MRIFTPTEIDFCKKIAEKEQDWSRVDWGSLVLYEDKIQIVINYFKSPNHPVINLADNEDHQDQIYNVLKLIPLWQEHDCLEWLRKKGWRVLDVYCNGKVNSPDHYSLAILPWDGKVSDNKDVMQFDEKTLLLCFLRAVLAVLEGK